MGVKTSRAAAPRQENTGGDRCMGNKVGAGPGHHATLERAVIPSLRVLGEPCCTGMRKDR